MYSDDEESAYESQVNYKQKYRELKKHLRALIYENECFQDELRKVQRNFVSISRDKSFLLDRILLYEQPTGISSDSDATESSDEDEDSKNSQFAPVQSFSQRKKITKRKRSEADLQNGASNQSNESFFGYMPGTSKGNKPTVSKSAPTKPSSAKKPKKPTTARKPAIKREKLSNDGPHFNLQALTKGYSHMVKRPASGEEQLHMGKITDFEDRTPQYEFESEGQMTREDIERHLEARRYSPELELNTTATVPAELFSQDPEQESDYEGSDFVQLDEDGTSADMILE